MAAHPYTNATDSVLLRRVTHAAVTVAVGLALMKLVAWTLTDSVSILASFLDSLLDAGASFINLVAVRYSLKAADREHRFGHGKAEPLAGMAQAGFVLGSALFLTLEAGGRLARPQPLSEGAVGIVVMVVSMVATSLLLLYQRHVIRRTGSVAIKADALHYVGDVLTNGAVILGIVLATELGWLIADPILALVVVAVLLWAGWSILKTSIDLLMDRELPDGERQAIIDIARDDPAVIDCHDLRTRSSGRQRFIQLHLTLDGELPLRRAHEIGERVASAIRAELAGAEVIVHHDPAGHPHDKDDFGGV